MTNDFTVLSGQKPLSAYNQKSLPIKIPENSFRTSFHLIPLKKNLNSSIMKCNVGRTDRIIRIIIGLGIAIAGVIFENYWGLIGIVVLATGIFGYCGPYWLMNINTNKKES